MIAEFESLPSRERQETLKAILAGLYPDGQKTIDRMLRRMENPEVPEIQKRQG